MEKAWLKYYPKDIPKEITIPVHSIFQLLERAAHENPSKIAIVEGEKEITYETLKWKSEQFAAGLLRRGFQKGERIAIMLENRLEYVIAYYAIQRLGGIVVQVNPMYQPFELEHILKDSEAHWVICKQEQFPKFQKLNMLEKLNIIEVDGDGNHSFNSLLQEEIAFLPSLDDFSKEDVAVLQYTSGTTGKSKGAMLTHSNVISNACQNTTFYRINSKDKVIGTTPFYHAMGMSYLNITIYSQGTYIMAGKFNVDEFLVLLRKYRPTIFPGVPTMFVSLLRSPNLKDEDLTCFRICVSGSAPIPTEVIREFEEKSGAKILEGFGLTECTSSATRMPIEGKRIIGSCGIPIPSTECKIVDLETGMEEVPIGEHGELILRGPQVMKGYWKNEEETNKALRDGWLYTGDIATMDENGYFYIVGRKKEMIVASGFNIYPTEIEEVLYEHPAVREAAVVGVPDTYRGETVKAVIVAKADVTTQEIEDWCSERLARYKVPKIIEFREELPKSSVGKILKRELVKKAAEV